MKKRLLAYIDQMEQMLKDNDLSTDEWKIIQTEHLTQLSFFQHERLIHLIVTVTFALLEMISLLIVMFHFSIVALLFSATIMILLIPYISHYYLLENGVQKMYQQYDQIQKHLSLFHFDML